LVNQSSDGVEAGTILAGRYRVERQLGKGGMGSVYLVQHLHTEQQLALKLLHAAVVTDEVALTRFRREARAPARINSDHVVQVTDADVAPELGGVPFLVMEWLRGQNLEDLVNERGTLPAEEVVLFLRHAARALDKALVLGIVHRDLKPENLFLTTREDGTPLVKILDFGIAKLTSGEGDGRLKATGTGQIFGTPLYMSPEQTKGEAEKISPQTDVWAVGIIAHRLLTGAEPWNATTITALIAQIAYEPLPVPSKTFSGLGAGFDAWFQRCCAREPGDRFPSAGEAVSELARALRVAEDAPSSALLRSAGAVVTRPPREETGDRTAFSATAPAPPSLSGEIAATRVSGPQAHPGPSRGKLAVGAALITLTSAVAAWAFVSRAHPATPTVAESPTAPPLPLPLPSATEPAPSAPPVTVTPSTTAPAPAVTPATASAAPLKAPADVRRPSHVEKPAATAPAPTAAAVAPPVPTPAKPDDPLGTRH
jgi:serine/threonine-protein kinase